MGGVSGTVVVCTRDRQPMLRGCLASLDDQTAPADDFDVVVVDNGSTDGTAAWLADWAAGADPAAGAPGSTGPHDPTADGNPGTGGPGLTGRHDPAGGGGRTARRRVVTEPVAGLSRARNAGIAAASGDVVLFLDDDALAPRGWIDAHLAVYRNAPATAAAGGPVMLTWPDGRPGWLAPQLEHWFSALDHGDRAGPFPIDHGPYGTNMSLRRDVLAEVGGFTERLGRRRRSLLSSEEAELWRRLWAAGHGIVYDPATLLLHRVSSARLSRRWLLRRGWGQGRSNARLRALTGEVTAPGQVARACRGEAGHAARLAVGATRAAVRGDTAGAVDAVARCAGHTAAGLEQIWLWVQGDGGTGEGPVRPARARRSPTRRATRASPAPGTTEAI